MSQDKILEALNDADRVREALWRGVQQAIREHKRDGRPMVSWRDGKVVWVPPEELPEIEAEGVSRSRGEEGFAKRS